MQISKSVPLLCLLAIVCGVAKLSAQRLLWDVDFVAMLDNREGGDPLRPDQTLFFTRLAPEIGLQPGADSAHRVMGGVAWYQPVSDNFSGYKVLPTLYYHYDDGRFSGAVGLFPRTLLHERLPRLLMSDSLAYCQPNVRGAMVSRHLPRKGYVQLMLDWRQLPTKRRREAFNVLLSTNVAIGSTPIRVKALVYYNHLAKSRMPDKDEGVLDDATLWPAVVVDLGGRTALQRLQIEAGVAVQMQRDRSIWQWRTPCAFEGAVRMSWRRLDAETALHAGANLFPLYDKCGPLLNLGDPYYCSKVYSRTDVRYHVVHTSAVDVSASLTFHATDRIIGFWQQISCRVWLNGGKKSAGKPLLPALF